MTPFTVSSGSGRNLEESFLWRESGLLQVQVRTSVTCTSTGDPCEEVDYGTGSYSIPAGATWLSTWSEPGVINLEAQSGGPVGEPVVVADPDALVIGLIYVGMDIFDYERDENIAITFSLLLCLGLAIGGAYFILRKMKQNLMGVMTAAAYFMFIFVGMGLVLFGVPPGLVVVMVAAPVIIFGLIFIRRLAL